MLNSDQPATLETHGQSVRDANLPRDNKNLGRLDGPHSGASRGGSDKRTRKSIQKEQSKLRLKELNERGQATHHWDSNYLDSKFPSMSGSTSSGYPTEVNDIHLQDDHVSAQVTMPSPSMQSDAMNYEPTPAYDTTQAYGPTQAYDQQAYDLAAYDREAYPDANVGGGSGGRNPRPSKKNNRKKNNK